MKKTRQALAILLCLYTLYLVKTELGINISRSYHAVDVLKMPLRAIHAVLGSCDKTEWFS